MSAVRWADQSVRVPFLPAGWSSALAARWSSALDGKSFVMFYLDDFGISHLVYVNVARRGHRWGFRVVDRRDQLVLAGSFVFKSLARAEAACRRALAVCS